MTDCAPSTLPIDEGRVSAGEQRPAVIAEHAEASVRGRFGWIIVTIAVGAVAVLLALLPGVAGTPPLVESDYCYLLIATDRMYEGLGPTTPLPVAPMQPWSYHADWTHLTRWPIGFPAFVCAVRYLTNLSTIEACRIISILATAAALVGWFTWVRRIVTNRVTGALLGMVSAGCAVSVSNLTDPSTDLLVVALLPYVLLACLRALGVQRENASDESIKPSMAWLVVTGILAGGLFWVRYASVFVPAATGVYLLLLWWRRSIRFGHLAVFSLSATAPIAALLAVNQVYGAGGSIQSQLNLGQTMALDLSPQLLAWTWWNFTDFSFYAHHSFVHWVYAFWPVALALVALTVCPIRRRVLKWIAAPAVALSAATVIVLLAMLAGVTAVFGAKYEFTGLARYYLPIKPLYFALFVGPMLLVRWRAIRVAAGIALLVACSWLVRQDWGKAYYRLVTTKIPATPYGQRAACFGAGADRLYGWLIDQRAADLVVVSNFHEYVALETGIPALPIPQNRATLDEWVNRVRRVRGMDNARVLFVLDRDNRWRDYWIRPPDEIVRDFQLRASLDLAVGPDAVVFEYHPS